MSAIEDALVARDFRAAKAWGLAVAVAIAGTQLAVLLGAVDVSAALYLSNRFHLFSTALGGLAFGLGMTLVGTCSFGLVVRGGGGDLRAAVAAVFVGVFAFASTSGVLAPARAVLWEFGVLDLPIKRPVSLATVAGSIVGERFVLALVATICLGLIALALLDRRLWHRPRLLLGSVLVGAAVALGWWCTTRAVDALALDRPESLSFVAPVGRALLQFMIEPFRNVGFGVAAVIGVAAASFVVALARGELRWEAFDDAREMRRHIFGAALMGVGGVLAQGCTIGQGLSAASVLALSAPVFTLMAVVGAKIGLVHLIEGRSLWRLGRTPRPQRS